MPSSDSTQLLPAPDREALAHSARLAGALREAIAAAGGALPFDEYMRLCLYAPGLGYYVAGTEKFGRGGDFTTAPELSPLLAQGLALQCAEILRRIGGGAIVEFGAGSGRLAADLLAALERLDCLPECYAVVEPGAELRERQRALLRGAVPRLADRVRWWSGLPSQPLPAVVIGNELLDALPVKRFEVLADGIAELCVQVAGDGFAWERRPASPALREAWDALPAALRAALPAGYRSECCVLLGPWLAEAARLLSRGAMLFCDYGYARHDYYHPQRADGTLICHYRHRAHADPFHLPGLQDISASVDFTLLAEAAGRCGLDLGGYTTQAAFLLATSVPAAFTTPVHGREGLRQANAARLLTLPGAMGERFKIMALLRDCAGPLCGFGRLDQRHRLLPMQAPE